MDSVEDRIKKAREERQAREKARILKLKEFNLSKYKSEDSKIIKHTSNSTISNKCSNFKIPIAKPKSTNNVKTHRESIAPIQRNISQNNSVTNFDKKQQKNSIVADQGIELCKNNIDRKSTVANKDHKLIFNLMSRKSIIPPKEVLDCKNAVVPNKEKVTSNGNIRKSMLPIKEQKLLPNVTDNKKLIGEKIMANIPKRTLNNSKVAVNRCEPKNFIKQNIVASTTIANKSILNGKNGSKLGQINFERKYNTKKLQPQDKTNVFDRLYNNTYTHRKTAVNEHESEKKHPPIPKTRHTMFNLKQDNEHHKVRRSISAIHLKKIDKNELKNCIQKWPSVGDRLNKLNLTNINEDATVNHSNISAVLSERKKALKPNKGITFNLNTPTADELQNRLTNWLQKRGKSLQAYQHLQCFGIRHLAPNAKESLRMPFDEENKENYEQIIPDDASYTDNMNERQNDFDDKKWLEENEKKWRSVSCISEADLSTTSDSNNVTLSSDEVQGQHVNDLMLGALNDLAELLREGFSWQLCARWLRSIRERFADAPNTAPYWECRAALEEAQGNFPGSVECWEEAIAKGAKTSMAEASLDQLLDKFMKLEISPSAGRKTMVEQKNMVDIKNVFKSTLIRFAVQQAKLKNAETPKYIATPVRRSNRLSGIMNSNAKRTPLLQLCTSIRQIDEEFKNNLTFIPNKTLEFTP